MGEHHHQYTRFSVLSLALTAGICWSLGILIIGLVAMQYELGKPFVDLFASIYIGFAATVKGSFVGAGWAFIDGFLGGLFFALVYNTILCICGSVCRAKMDKKS